IPAFIALFLAARAIWVYRLMDITPSLAADQILSTMVTPLIVCDSDQIIRLVNDVTCEIFGYREQELVGQPVDIFVKGSDEEKHRLRDALKSLLVKNQELVFFSKNNGPVDICVSISHLFGRNQTKLASIIVASDMRERKKSEQDLLEKKIELARSNAEREQLELFAYVASHDLKEPLQKIIGFGELLGKNFKEKLPAEGRDYLERMINATLRMNQLIEDLIKFSKVAMNAEQAPLTRINLKELLQDVLSDLETKVVQSKGEVIIGELPSLNANRLEMHQLFQNLIGNALKFHPKDAPPKITITGNLLDKDSVEIRVADNGIGFDEQYAAKIFKPFERLHGRSEYDGSGLGLAICHRIAKNHRGRIIAQSTPGKGSVFTLTLPLNLI
ncbi:MAG TPA: ATP-binding protein, partial [bacterium]|nr:ATP-binding protein [bacterium]